MSELLYAILTATGLGFISSVYPCVMGLNLVVVALIQGKEPDDRAVAGTWQNRTVPVNSRQTQNVQHEPVHEPGGKRKNIISKIICFSGIYLAGRIGGYIIFALILKFGFTRIQPLVEFLRYNLFLYLGPLLVLIGMIFTGILPLKFIKVPSLKAMNKKYSFNRYNRNSTRSGITGMFFLGLLHSFALCPASAGIYFGVLFPIAITIKQEILLSVFFGFGAFIIISILTFIVRTGFTLITSRLKEIITGKILPLLSGIILILIGIYYSIIYIFIPLLKQLQDLPLLLIRL